MCCCFASIADSHKFGYLPSAFVHCTTVAKNLHDSVDSLDEVPPFCFRRLKGLQRGTVRTSVGGEGSAGHCGKAGGGEIEQESRLVPDPREVCQQVYAGESDNAAERGTARLSAECYVPKRN